MEITTRIVEVYKIGKPEAKAVIIKCENFEQKMEILQQKKKLPTNVFMDNDLTQNEQKIQATIWNLAREERRNGKRTKVGYKKLIVDGELFKWDDAKGGSLIRAEGPKN